jgi:hypothetical protein
MKDKIFCAEDEGAFDFAAKGRNTLFADLDSLAADVDQVAGG